MILKPRNDVLVSERADRYGAQLLDEIDAQISTERILGTTASPEGIAYSLLHGRSGFEVDALGVFQPGIDDPLNFDANESLGNPNEEPKARKVLGFASPKAIHVVMDVPERTGLFEGKHTAEYIGAFALGVSAKVANVISDTDLFVYHSKAPRGLIYEGGSEDAVQVFRNLKRIENTDEKSLDELLSTAAQLVEDESHATVLVSDFMDGFDAENSKFSWEPALRRLSARQEDLLRIVRVSSKSHERIAPYSIKGLDYATVQKMNKAYAEQARAKNDRINTVFGNLMAKTVTISLAEEKPSRKVINLLLGEAPE